MARNAATVDIGINVPASEIRKAEQQLGALFNKAQAFNKNPIVSKNYTQPLGRITGAANEFNKSLAASNARVIAFGASAGAIFAVQKAMSELVKTTIQVEQQLKNIEVLLGATDKEFRRFSDGLFKTAQQTGKSFADVAASAEEFARQGLNVEATLKRNNAAMVLSKLGAMDVKNATESLTAAINTFGKSAGDATTIVNKLAQVDAKFAVSSGDLAEAIKRSGAAAVSANVEFEQFISVVTLAQERTARGGAVIGNSFKTIFTRLQRNETLRELEKLGVATRNFSTGELLPAMTILKNYAKVYETLAPTVKASTAQMLAGVFQVNVLKSVLPELASEYGRYNQALTVANTTTNEATERMKELTSTTQGMLNKTMVNLTKFASEVGNLTIKPALERILNLMNGFADLIGPENFFGLGETIGTAVYKGMGKIIEGPGLLLLGVVIAKIAGRLGGYVKDAAAGFMGIQTQSQKLADTQNVIQNLLASRPALINQAMASEEGMVAVVRVLAQKLKESSMEMERLTAAAQRAAPAVLAMQGGAKSAGGKKIGAKGFVPGFASGFVPNFDMATQERRMASAGGYQAGKIKEATLPGVGRVTYNGNEKIKQFPGLEQPGIMPPALSPAGKNYRDSFRSVHGFDPYNSAGGFVPNFSTGGLGQSLHYQHLTAKEKSTYNGLVGADKRKFWNNLSPERQAELHRKGGGKTSGQYTAENRTKRDPAYTHPFDVGGRIGILGFSGMMNRKATASMFIKDLSAMNEVVAMNPALGNDKIQFNNVQVSSATGLAKDAKRGGKPFFEKISDFLAKPLADLTQYFSESVLGNQGKLDTASITKQLKGRNALLPPGAEGDIFEAVVKILTTEPKHLRRAFDAKRDFKAPFDFEEVGRATPKFRQTFGYTSRLERADAKRSATQDTVNTVVKKGINWALLNPSASFAKHMKGAPGMSYGSAITPKGAGGQAGYHTADTRTAASMRVGNLGSALGFVPNFAAAGSRMGSKEAMKRSQATVSAIQREHQAGIPKSQIRVGFDKRIAGGVGVFNTSETSLGNAINMHMARGASMKDIQTMGAAGGFVPNFETIAYLAANQPAHKGGPVNLDDALPKTQASGSRSVATQAAAQVKSASNSLTEGSMMMSMAMMMAGSQLSVFGASLQESESSVKRVSGEFISLAGTVAMYYPVIQMATASMGGISGALALFGTKIKAMGVAISTSTKSFIANSRAVAGSTVAQGMSGLMFGRGGGMAGGMGRARAAYRAGSMTKIQGPTLPGQAGLGRIKTGGLAGVRGGLANVGSRVGGVVGMGARGGAAVLGGGAATVAAGAAAAYGGYKIYQAINDADFGKVSKQLSESLNLAKDKTEKFGKALSEAGEALSELDKQQRRGGDTTKAREQVVASLSGAAFGDMIAQQPGGSLSVPGVGDGSLSRAEILKIMGDENTSSQARNDIMTAATKLKDRYARATDQVEGINAVIDTIKDNQGFWWSTKMTAEDIAKFGGNLADVFGEVSSDTAKRLLPELQKVQDAFSKLDSEAIISTRDLRTATNKLGNFLKNAPIEAKVRQQLIGKLKELTNTTNLSEDDLHEFYKKVLPYVKDELEGLANASDFVGDNLKQVPIDKLHNAILVIEGEFNTLGRQLTFTKGLQDIFQDETTKMFDLATKTLQSELGKTASELTKIQITQELARRRVDISSQDKLRKIEEDSSKQMFDIVKKFVVPKSSSTEAQAGVFPDFDTFDKVVGGSFAKQMRSAIADADFASAQQLIQNALNNQKALSTAGGGLKGGTPLRDELLQMKTDMANLNEAQKDRIELEKQRNASEKRYIDAQKQAAEAQLSLAQRIQFLGGIQGAGGKPQTAIAGILQNPLDIRRGRGVQVAGGGRVAAGRDVEMQGILGRVNLLKSLASPGVNGQPGTNPANIMVKPLTEEIRKNLQQTLRVVFDSAGGDLTGTARRDAIDKQIASTIPNLDKIASAQAEAFIKPDKTLTDVWDNTNPLKDMIFNAAGQVVYVANWKDIGQQGIQDKDLQKLIDDKEKKDKDERENVQKLENKPGIVKGTTKDPRTHPAIRQNMVGDRLADFEAAKKRAADAGQRVEDIPGEIKKLERERVERVRRAQKAQDALGVLNNMPRRRNFTPPGGGIQPRLGPPAGPFAPPLAPPNRTLGGGPHGTDARALRESFAAEMSAAEAAAKRIEELKKEENTQKTKKQLATDTVAKLEKEEAEERKTAKNTQRERLQELQGEIIRFTQQMKGLQGTSEQLQYARADANVAFNRQVKSITADKVIDENELKAIQELSKNLGADVANRLEQRKRADQGAELVRNVAGETNSLNDPISTALTAAANAATVSDEFQDSFKIIENTVKSFLETNKPFPNALEDGKKALKNLSLAVFGNEAQNKAATKTFDTEADRIKYVKEQLMLLQNTMDMTAFRNGRKTLKEVRDGLLQTIDVLTSEKKPIKKQLKDLKELENARIKEARSTRNATSSTKFIQEASDQIIALGSDFAAVGIKSERANEDIKKLQRMRNRLAKGGMTAKEMEKFADKLEKLGLKAKEAKRKLGLISPQEFIDDFLKVWTNGQKRTVEVTKKALADLYKGIGDVDVDPEKRKKELGEKFAEVISGAVKDMSSEMEGQALSSSLEYFRLTGDQAKATQKLNQLDQERIFLFDMVSEGIITEAEAQRLFAQEVRNATAETDKLSRELGYIDAKEFKERFIKRIQEGIQDGSVTAGEGIRRTFKQIGDLAINADLRESEIRKGLGTSISNAIATLSSDAIGENMNISTELYKVTGDLNLAQQQAINLDKTRVSLFRKLRRGSITLAEALEKMGEAQDKAAKRVDTNKRKRGQQSESEFIERESTRFNNALKRSGTDTGGALEAYFASITDLGGVFDATKMREAKTQSAKSIGELLKKTVTEASAEAQSLANQLAGFERSGVEGMANKAAEETLKIRQKQKQVEMEFAVGLISRVEADQKLAEINREATDRVTKLAMAVGTLSDAAGKSQLLDNRKADLNQRGFLDDTLFNQNRRQQFGLDQTAGQRFRNTEVGMGGMMMDRDADLSKNAISAERDLVKQRFEQTGDYNNALSLANDLEKRRMEILAEGAKNGESLIEIERQLNFARMDTAAKGLGQALQNGSITADQYRQNIGALSEDLMNGSLEAADKTKVWKMELGALFALDKNYGFKQLVAGTKDVFMTLREGIKGALKDVITGAKSMREALQGVFAAIADKMLDRTIGSLVDTIFYALMPRPYGMYNKGGQVKGYNGGGIVRGGSGVRDDVPAVLTRGEYVVRKKAVNKYGRGFIEQLNQGRIKKYADGGSASFSLMNQFDYNDPKRPTAGTMNVDSRMSAFAQTDTNNPMNQLKFDKEKTLDSYLKEKAQYEEQKRQAMANYKKQRRGLIRSMFIQIGMMGLTYGINKAIAKSRGAASAGGMTPSAAGFSSESPAPAGTTAVRGIDGTVTFYKNAEIAMLSNPGIPTNQMVTANPVQMNMLGMRSQSFSRPVTGGGLNFGGGAQPNAVGHNAGAFAGGRGRSSMYGGYEVPQQTSGGRAGMYGGYDIPELRSKGGPMMGGRDNIPALLTGGEYVVNKQSVGKYGLDFFNKLNAGKLPGFNSGGLVGENNGSTRMTDGGGAPSNVNNNITINVTVEKDGNVNTDTTNEQAGGNQNTQGALNEEERNKQFSGAIKDAVVREIVEQKRPGGLLYNEKRSGT